jgi:dihydrofolate reductase
MIVLSRQPGFASSGVEVVGSLEEALQCAATDAEVFIGGGADLYRQAMPRAQRLQLTRIEADFEGDASFPDFDSAEWVLNDDAEQPPTTAFPHGYRFQTWERRPARSEN